jgi:hypothetical protein
MPMQASHVTVKVKKHVSNRFSPQDVFLSSAVCNNGYAMLLSIAEINFTKLIANTTKTISVTGYQDSRISRKRNFEVQVGRNNKIINYGTPQIK